jgi:hypothetical protein
VTILLNLLLLILLSFDHYSTLSLDMTSLGIL